MRKQNRPKSELGFHVLSIIVLALVALSLSVTATFGQVVSTGQRVRLTTGSVVQTDLATLNKSSISTAGRVQLERDVAVISFPDGTQQVVPRPQTRFVGELGPVETLRVQLRTTDHRNIEFPRSSIALIEVSVERPGRLSGVTKGIAVGAAAGVGGLLIACRRNCDLRKGPSAALIGIIGGAVGGLLASQGAQEWRPATLPSPVE